MSAAEQYVAAEDLRREFGIVLHRSTLFRMEQAARFPKRRYYLPRKFHYLRSEIEAWMAERHASTEPDPSLIANLRKQPAITRALAGAPTDKESHGSINHQ